MQVIASDCNVEATVASLHSTSESTMAAITSRGLGQMTECTGGAFHQRIM